MKRHHQIIPIIIILFLFIPFISFANKYRVIRIVDGDTIIVNYQGNNEKVRLLRVNTLLMGKDQSPGGRGERKELHLWPIWVI